MYNIDFKLLTDAIDYYSYLGYEKLSAPYLVDRDIILETTTNEPLVNNNLCYVGSAEQSFLQLIKDGLKPVNNFKYMLITPCQRNEPVIDQLHLNIFLKIELISYSHIINDVLNFCYKTVNDKNTISAVITNTGMDIELNEIEIGSYGNRTYKDINFYYGTGLALPRFSQAYARNIK